LPKSYKKKEITYIFRESKTMHLRTILILLIAFSLSLTTIATPDKKNHNEKHSIKSQVIFINNLKQDTTKPQDTILFVIDGKVRPDIKSVAELDSIVKPNEVYSINVLKGAAAVDLYGDEGKNGVVQIITKSHAGSSTTSKFSETTNSASLSKDHDIIFEKTEVAPSFPGGQMAWRKFLERNLKAEIPNELGAPAGTYTVLVRFVVDTSGQISDLHTLSNFGYGMEKEVLRIMKLSPNWVPALQNGHKVKCYRQQSVTFLVERF